MTELELFANAFAFLKEARIKQECGVDAKVKVTLAPKEEKSAS
ncbi:hypothetical protein [Oscillibacter ruminantium]|nr:hypothetical protein [Oscillibacter ruminantium]